MAVETVFDKLMKRGVLTEEIVEPTRTALEAAPRLGDQIAPLRDVDGDSISMLVRRIAAFGIGQVRAPEATPPLVDLTGAEETPQTTSLLHYDEMHRISPTRWEKLQSEDDRVAAEEARSLIEIGQQLEERLERLTEVHRWQAFAGEVTYQYQNIDSVLKITYPLPTGNKPVVATAWTDTTNADPVADLIAFRNQVANEAGNPGVLVHISSEDIELILNNAKLRGYFNIPVGQPFRPLIEDVAQLVGAGTSFIPTDGGYRPESAGTATTVGSHVKYKPIGKVLVTTDYNNNGIPIADTPNGDIEIQTGYNTGVFLKGPQSEIKMHELSMQRFLRHGAKRIPRLRQPGAFLYATVRA